MDIRIREARPDDAEQVIALVRSLAEEPDRNIITGPGEFSLTVDEERRFLAECAAQDHSVFLVAEVDGRIVGALDCQGGQRKAVRHAVTLGMSVHRDWRDQGIGSRLMAEGIEWARRSGVVKRIELSVFARNQRAIHLYEKFGFQVEGRRRKSIYQDGEYLDDLIMARWV